MPSKIISAFLYAQLDNLEIIQAKRKSLWNRYYKNLESVALKHGIGLPYLDEFATNNAHMFYVICKDLDQRSRLIGCLKQHAVLSVFHYLSLHASTYFKDSHDGRKLVNTDRFSDCLLRLPMFYELQSEQIDSITGIISNFLEKENV